jgi:hypothetical protein
VDKAASHWLDMKGQPAIGAFAFVYQSSLKFIGRTLTFVGGPGSQATGGGGESVQGQHAHNRRLKETSSRKVVGESRIRKSKT